MPDTPDVPDETAAGGAIAASVPTRLRGWTDRDAADADPSLATQVARETARDAEWPPLKTPAVPDVQLRRGKLMAGPSS